MFPFTAADRRAAADSRELLNHPVGKTLGGIIIGHQKTVSVGRIEERDLLSVECPPAKNPRLGGMQMDQIRFYPVRDLPELNKSTDIMAGVNGSFKIPDTDQMHPVIKIFPEIIRCLCTNTIGDIYIIIVDKFIAQTDQEGENTASHCLCNI